MVRYLVPSIFLIALFYLGVELFFRGALTP